MCPLGGLPLRRKSLASSVLRGYAPGQLVDSLRYLRIPWRLYRSGDFGDPGELLRAIPLLLNECVCTSDCEVVDQGSRRLADSDQWCYALQGGGQCGILGNWNAVESSSHPANGNT